jgi:hypothetical protein
MYVGISVGIPGGLLYILPSMVSIHLLAVNRHDRKCGLWGIIIIIITIIV